MTSSNARSRAVSAYTVKLLAGTALVGGAMFAGSVAYAQNEQVVVTGTSIRGTAPVGANIISVDRTTIEETAAVTTSELMTNIPQITGAAGGFGSSGQRNEGGGGAIASPNIHSLGTQASTATLILIDGHVFAPVGQTTNVVDPSIIPTAALQRVEVLPDGASAIYGANAVAGVINFITRRDYSGWETRVQAGVADHYNTFSASQLFGHTWDTGSVMAVYGYSSRSNLYSKWRKFETSRQDIRMGAMTAEQAQFFGAPLVNTTTNLPNNPPAGIPTTLVSDPIAVAGSDPYRGMAIPFPSIGANSQNFNCPVAAISATNTSNAFLYPYTTGGINNVTVTNGSGGTMTESGFRRTVTNGGTQGVCDQDDYSSDLISSTQNNILVAIRQQITDRISVNVDLVRGSHLTSSPSSRGNLSAWAFNPGGTGGPAFGSNQKNPFYVGVPGAATNATSEFVTYNFDQLLGKGAYSKQNTTNQFATLGLDVDLGNNWALTIGSTLGSSSTNSRGDGTVVNAQALLALNGTTNTQGTAGNTIVDPYVLGTVTTITRALTTANALDVWQPASTNRTSAAVRRSLVDSSSNTTVFNNIQDVTVKVDGPVGDFWGAGDIKTAFGANYNHLTQPQYLAANNGFGPSSTSSSGRTFAFARTSYAAFAEFIIPLVSRDWEIPLVQTFTLDIAGRYDHFSDFGETKNPKVSFSWGIIDGIQGRGSFSTSFVAPNVHDVGGPQGINSQTQIQSSTITSDRTIAFRSVAALPYSQDPFTARGVGTVGTFVESPASCLAFRTAGGYTASQVRIADINGTVVADNTPLGSGAGQAYGCKIQTGNSNPNFTGLQIGGAKADLKPERGLTYSAGIDLDAGQIWDVLTGLTAQVTYYNTKFLDVVTNQQVETNIPEATSFGPAPSASNPLGGWSITDPNIQALIAGRRVTNTLPARVYTITDNRIQNPFTIWQAGFDFDIGYRYETDDYGTFTLSTNANWIVRFSQKANSSTAAVNDVNGCKNGARYCSSEMPGAVFRLGWRMDAFTAGLTFNYVKPYNFSNPGFPYNQPTNPNFQGVRTTTVANGATINYFHVGSLQTFDLNLGYTLPEEWLSGSQISLTVNNLLDMKPPFFPNSNGFTNGSQIGRLVSVGITKKW